MIENLEHQERMFWLWLTHKVKTIHEPTTELRLKVRSRIQKHLLDLQGVSQ
jgi:hypothetical protein